MIAIVASLIFVGLQMRQPHEIALVTLYEVRSDATRELLAVEWTCTRVERTNFG